MYVRCNIEVPPKASSHSRKSEYAAKLTQYTKYLLVALANIVGQDCSTSVKVRRIIEKVVLAQIAYRAYGDWLEWKTPQGKRLLNWDELQMYLRNAWTAAAETVAIRVRKDELIPEVHPVGA